MNLFILGTEMSFEMEVFSENLRRYFFRGQPVIWLVCVPLPFILLDGLKTNKKKIIFHNKLTMLENKVALTRGAQSSQQGNFCYPNLK